MDKKAQLGVIEAKFAFYGFVAGVVITLAILLLANKTDILPKLTFLC